jgi:hypothetical protein
MTLITIFVESCRVKREKMGLLIFLAFALVSAQDFIDDSTNPPRGSLFPPDGYDAQALPFDSGAARERPTGSPPVSISVAVGISSIFEVIDRTQTFKADLVRELRWYDQRFDDTSLPALTKPSTSQMGSIWTPRVTFDNMREFLRPMDFHCSVFNNGTVVVLERFVQTFASRLDVHRFPFDSQTFTVVMRSARYDQVSCCVSGVVSNFKSRISSFWFL